MSKFQQCGSVGDLAMDEIGDLTTDVAVSLASEVGVTLQVDGNHDDVAEGDLHTIEGLVESVDPSDPGTEAQVSLSGPDIHSVSVSDSNAQEAIGMLLQSQQVQVSC